MKNKTGDRGLKEAVRMQEGNIDYTVRSQGFLLASDEGWQASRHSARQAGWQTDWVGGEDVEEWRPPVPPLLRCDQASLREQWPL